MATHIAPRGNLLGDVSRTKVALREQSIVGCTEQPQILYARLAAARHGSS